MPKKSKKIDRTLPSAEYTVVEHKKGDPSFKGWRFEPFFRGVSLRAGFTLTMTSEEFAYRECTEHAAKREKAEDNLKTAGGDFRKLHDTDLPYLDAPEAKAVLEGRTRAAAQIRLVLARTYASGDMCTASCWSVLPCLTDKGTIGILDIARGTAWDTGVEADPGVHDLGVEGEVYAAANGIAGTVRFDGEIVRQDGASPGKPPKMPPGWGQIALPTWRGHEGTSPYRPTPASAYTPETWIKPTLVATGLMTCYGEPGKPRTTLSDTAGWHIERDTPSENHWPNGVPAWIAKGFENDRFRT